MSQVTIPLSVLQAARPFTSIDATRPVLNYLHTETLSDGKAIVVATDGHGLSIVAWSTSEWTGAAEQLDGPIYLHRAIVDYILKLPKPAKTCAQYDKAIKITITHGVGIDSALSSIPIADYWSYETMGTQFVLEPLWLPGTKVHQIGALPTSHEDGRINYPDYRSITQTKPKEGDNSLWVCGADLLERVCKIAKKWEGKMASLQIESGEDEISPFKITTFKSDESIKAMFILMPMRITPQQSAPPWALQPAK